MINMLSMSSTVNILSCEVFKMAFCGKLFRKIN